MELLRHLVGIQLLTFLWAPPIATATAFGRVEWLLVGIPWLLFCVFLYGWVQGRGIATFREFAFPLRIRIAATDGFHLSLLKVNAVAILVLSVALYARGLI